MRYKRGQLIVRGEPVCHGGSAFGVLAVKSAKANVEVCMTESQITNLIAALQQLRSSVCAARKEQQN